MFNKQHKLLLLYSEDEGLKRHLLSISEHIVIKKATQQPLLCSIIASFFATFSTEDKRKIIEKLCIPNLMSIKAILFEGLKYVNLRYGYVDNPYDPNDNPIESCKRDQEAAPFMTVLDYNSIPSHKESESMLLEPFYKKNGYVLK